MNKHDSKSINQSICRWKERKDEDDDNYLRRRRRVEGKGGRMDGEIGSIEDDKGGIGDDVEVDGNRAGEVAGDDYYAYSFSLSSGISAFA